MPCTRPSQLGSPSHYRQHALGKLDAVIATAEKERRERLEVVDRLAKAKKSTARAKARLSAVEYRLALLNGSRRWLTSGTPPVA